MKEHYEVILPWMVTCSDDNHVDFSAVADLKDPLVAKVCN